MNELAGQSLGGYQLEEEIGRGSMGVVYRGKQIALGREVAIKVLPQVLARDSSFVARFIREAQIIAGLNHPNIVHIYDAGQQNKLLYFVMEYVQGPTLSSLIRLDGRIPQHLAVEYAAQIADALDAAYHERHVIHRDIKPENLMLNRWGKIKVMDFGLARAGGYQPITVTKTLVGSIYYASPEQVGGYPLDNRSDIYALGVVLYEMVTGQRPFTGRSIPELTRAILYNAPLPPSALAPDLSSALEQIIVNTLAKDRSHRYDEARLLAQDLRSLNLQPPVSPLLLPAAGFSRPTLQGEHTFTRPPKRPTAQRPDYSMVSGEHPQQGVQAPIAHIVSNPIPTSLPVVSQQSLLPANIASTSLEIVRQDPEITQVTQVTGTAWHINIADENTASLASQHKRRSLWQQLQRLFKPSSH